MILRWLEQLSPGRVLDLGCSSGLLASRVRSLGHEVTGADMEELPGVAARLDRFVRVDLDRGLPEAITDAGPFDVVLAADVLEHIRDPARLLKAVRGVLADRGVLIASVPNFGHWYARGRTALGVFDYDQRGVLDRGHVRFFTRRSFLRLLRDAGFSIERQVATGLPLELLTQRRGAGIALMRTPDRLSVAARPTLFGYQFVCQCEAPPTATVSSARSTGVQLSLGDPCHVTSGLGTTVDDAARR